MEGYINISKINEANESDIDLDNYSIFDIKYNQRDKNNFKKNVKHSSLNKCKTNSSIVNSQTPVFQVHQEIQNPIYLNTPNPMYQIIQAPIQNLFYPVYPSQSMMYMNGYNNYNNCLLNFKPMTPVAYPSAQLSNPSSIPLKVNRLRNKRKS